MLLRPDIKSLMLSFKKEGETLEKIENTLFLVNVAYEHRFFKKTLFRSSRLKSGFTYASKLTPLT